MHFPIVIDYTCGAEGQGIRVSIIEELVQNEELTAWKTSGLDKGSKRTIPPDRGSRKGQSYGS